MPFLTRVHVWALILCLLVLVEPARAQAPSLSLSLPAANAPVLPASETIHSRVDEVNVVFTVTDSSGRFINKLSLDDLNVLDNLRAPERISYFQQQSDLPLHVGVLVDLSDSVTARFQFEKKAAITFLQKVLRPGVDEAFVVGFATEVNLLQDFTGDIGMLSRAVQHMRLGGETRLYDAVRFAAAKLHGAPGANLSRRVIVLITDGVDTRSSATMSDAIQVALHGETALFALNSNPGEERNSSPGDFVLDLMTRATGGNVLRAYSKSEIAHAFNLVRSALRSQYVVGYKPAAFKRDGKFRTIQILPHKNKLRVHCRRGYFAPQEDQASAAQVAGP